MTFPLSLNVGGGFFTLYGRLVYGFAIELFDKL